MTNTDLLLIVAGLMALMVYYRSNLKQGKRLPKPRRRIQPRSGRIKRKCVALRYRPPGPEQIAFMERCRQQNIEQSRFAQPTMNVCAALRSLGIRFMLEEPTWYDGDRFVLSDFWLPDLRACVELNGSQHRLERVRDAEKAKIIFQSRGVRTIEYWNRDAMRPDFAARLKKDLGL